MSLQKKHQKHFAGKNFANKHFENMIDMVENRYMLIERKKPNKDNKIDLIDLHTTKKLATLRTDYNNKFEIKFIERFDKQLGLILLHLEGRKVFYSIVHRKSAECPEVIAKNHGLLVSIAIDQDQYMKHLQNRGLSQ